MELNRTEHVYSSPWLGRHRGGDSQLHKGKRNAEKKEVERKVDRKRLEKLSYSY
jgi:hypothetical protein